MVYDVLIGMESSGTVREACRVRGINAWSCDILPADDGSPYHIQGDAFIAASKYPWRFGIFHPSCTYLTCSAAWAFNDPDFDKYPGVGYHQRIKPGTLTGEARRIARTAALADVQRLIDLPFPKVIENPAVSFINKAIRPPDQVIHPHQFGDDASKGTGLWLDRIGPLELDPSKQVAPRYVDGKPRWANQTDSGQNRLSPSDDRWKIRSKTYQGIADALADAAAAMLN